MGNSNRKEKAKSEMNAKANQSAINDDNYSEVNFSQLPPHLQAAIFQRLDLVERLNARLVSHDWNAMVLESVQLVLTIDASKFDSDNNTGIIATFCLRHKLNYIDGVSFNGCSLNDLVNRLPLQLMNRVFKIRVSLGPECSKATGLLSEIAARIARTCAFELVSQRLPLSVFTYTRQADATFAKEFPTLALERLWLECDFNETGNNPLHYFSGDNAAKQCEEVNIVVRARPSDELLALIADEYPSTTKLALDFCNTTYGSNNGANNNNQPQQNPPDWSRLRQLRSLCDLVLLSTAQAAVQLPVMSSLKTFGSFNAVLPPAFDFFGFTPQLEQIELKRNHNAVSQMEIKEIALGIRSGHLNRLKFAKFDIDSPSQEASFDNLQLLLKAIVGGCSSNAQAPFTLCWSQFDMVSADNQRGLVDLLGQLPAGIFHRRQVILKVAMSDILRLSSTGVYGAVEDRIPEIIGAIHRTGLQQLTTRCSFSKGSLKAIYDGLRRTVELGGEDVHLGLGIPDPYDENDYDDLRPSFTSAVPTERAIVYDIDWQVNGREQKLQLVQLGD